MKIKEQYTHILYAKQEWQEQLKNSEYIPSKYCSKKLQQYLLKNYCNWEISECFHCCYGWKKCCWVDPYAEGMWDFSEEDIKVLLKEILLECHKNSHNRPIFYMYEKDNKVNILITYRHLSNMYYKDYVITGIKNKYNI